MIIDIYAATKQTSDGQNFAVVMIDEPSISYTFIKSLGSEPMDALNAEILALEGATRLAYRLCLTNNTVNLFHSLDNVLSEKGVVREGNTSNDIERFYCVIESMVLENLLFINDAEKNLVMLKVPKDENIALIAIGDNDLGYYVDIDDLQITDSELANDFLSVVK